MPTISLSYLAQPDYFDLIVDIGKKLSTDKQKPALNIGRTIGHLLANVCDSKYCTVLQKCDTKARNMPPTSKGSWKLSGTALWSFCIETDTEWKKQLHVIPVTEDLQMFWDHILKNIQQLSTMINKKPESDTWLKLTTYVMCRLIMFNKKRWAEVRELEVKEYLMRLCWSSDINSKIAWCPPPGQERVIR